MAFFLFFLIGAFIQFVTADTRVYNFTAGWVTRNPDGMYSRPVIGINGQWPLPRIEANVGDRVIVNLKNDLGNASTSIHFHGLYMNGTNHMDGVAGGTQCPVPPGSSFTYNFTITQPGTYWYHSHVDGQYPDGFRGPLIIHDPSNPYADLYDEELVITLSDWYHDNVATLLKSFITVTNPGGAEPIPKSALMNDTQNLQIKIQPGKTYFLRIVNMAAFASQYFWVEDHSLRIIEVDGVYHKPQSADMIYISAAQRYGVLLTTKNQTTSNYAIVGAMDTDIFDSVPATLNPNVTSYLVYNSSASLPTPALLDSFDAFDDFDLVPTDDEPLLENPDVTVALEVLMANLGDGANYAFFSGVTYVRPKVPTLYTVLSSGNLSTDPTIYGTNTHPIVLKHNQVVELVINNHDGGKHPFHHHGRAFQVIARGDDSAGDWDPQAVTNGSLALPKSPMRRDTLIVHPNSHIVMRFRSDNPGVWLFHCHIEWHVDSGLVMTFIEAPEQIQQIIKIPDDHLEACAALSPPMPTQGNAAANNKNFLDLTGQNLPPAPLPAGFTSKGIVALVFSCLAAFLGMSVVGWYSTIDIGGIKGAI